MGGRWVGKIEREWEVGVRGEIKIGVGFGRVVTDMRWIIIRGLLSIIVEQMEGEEEYLLFDHQSRQRNKHFCEEVIARKDAMLREYKLQRVLKADTSSILKDLNMESGNHLEEGVSHFNLQQLIVQDYSKEGKEVLQKEKQSPKEKPKSSGKVNIKRMSHSLKVNGVNLVMEVFQDEFVLEERTCGVMSFINKSKGKPKVIWPGNKILHKNPEAKASLQNVLKRDNFQKYIDIDIALQTGQTIGFFNVIKQYSHLPEIIQRMISVMRVENYQVIHISTSFGFDRQNSDNDKGVSDEDALATVLNLLIKKFRQIQNQPTKIVLCCNKQNMFSCWKVFNQVQNKLLVQKMIDLS